MRKVALIFGITGQDGSYLAEFLLKKKYVVHGVKRRSSSINTSRIDHIYQEPNQKYRNFFLHYGDITDSTSVSKIIRMIKPHEIYNLAAQSHVAVSFEVPEYTANADALGALRILEAIKFHKLEKKTKFYQAGTSEMYGKVQKIPQDEKTEFYPQSPYEGTPLSASYASTSTIPLCIPDITTESSISAVLSSTNLPSIIISESLGGTSASLITLVFLVFPNVLVAKLFL